MTIKIEKTSNPLIEGHQRIYANDTVAVRQQNMHSLRGTVKRVDYDPSTDTHKAIIIMEGTTSVEIVVDEYASQSEITRTYS